MALAAKLISACSWTYRGNATQTWDEIIGDLHDTFYGMREFIIPDLSPFWVTLGQSIAT